MKVFDGLIYCKLHCSPVDDGITSTCDGLDSIRTLKAGVKENSNRLKNAHLLEQ